MLVFHIWGHCHLKLHTTILSVKNIKSSFTSAGDTITINSSLIISNVTIQDLDNYSCVAINKGGMAESRTLLTLHNHNVWDGTIQVYYNE